MKYSQVLVADRRDQTSPHPLMKNTRRVSGIPKPNAPHIPPLLPRHNAVTAQQPPGPNQSPWKQRRMRTRMMETPTRTGPRIVLRSPSKDRECPSPVAQRQTNPTSLYDDLLFVFLPQAQSGPGQRSGHFGKRNPRCCRGWRLTELWHGHHHLTKFAAQHASLHHLCQGGGGQHCEPANIHHLHHNHHS